MKHFTKVKYKLGTMIKCIINAEKNQGADLGNQNRFGFLEAVTELFIFRSKLFAVSTPIITGNAKHYIS